MLKTTYGPGYRNRGIMLVVHHHRKSKGGQTMLTMDQFPNGYLCFSKHRVEDGFDHLANGKQKQKVNRERKGSCNRGGEKAK